MQPGPQEKLESNTRNRRNNACRLHRHFESCTPGHLASECPGGHPLNANEGPGLAREAAIPPLSPCERVTLFETEQGDTGGRRAASRLPTPSENATPRLLSPSMARGESRAHGTPDIMAAFTTHRLKLLITDGLLDSQPSARNVSAPYMVDVKGHSGKRSRVETMPHGVRKPRPFPPSMTP
jgi:hypothetical protein